MTRRAPHRHVASTIELLEMMLFVQCAKVWKQQRTDGSSAWMAQGVIHPFVMFDAIDGKSPGDALFNAYTVATGHELTRT
jgi:hypothetical protein